MTHPDEGPEAAEERDRLDAEWTWDADARGYKPYRPIADVRAAGVAVRFVLWVCAALIGTVGLAYAVAWAWE